MIIIIILLSYNLTCKHSLLTESFKTVQNPGGLQRLLSHSRQNVVRLARVPRFSIIKLTVTEAVCVDVCEPTMELRVTLHRVVSMVIQIHPSGYKTATHRSQRNSCCHRIKRLHECSCFSGVLVYLCTASQILRASWA